jgi:hypothetical protein
MDFLMKHAVPRARIGADTPLTINALHTRSGIPLQSLQNAIGAENDYSGKLAGDGKLGIEHQSRIANLFGFEVGGPQNPAAWPEWQDWDADEAAPADSRRDTAQKFREAYLRKYRASRDTLRQLMEGPERAPIPCEVRGLASIWLTSGQTGKGTSDIGVHISCGSAHTGVTRYWVSVCAAQLEINCGEARAKIDTIKGLNTPGFAVKGSHGEVSCYWNSGDPMRLTWILDGKGNMLGDIDFEPGLLSTVEKLAPGDVITATLGTWLKNIATGEAPVTEISLTDRPGGSEIKLDEATLTIEQQRVIEHLRKKVLKLHDDNFAELAKHELEFVEGNR